MQKTKKVDDDIRTKKKHQSQKLPVQIIDNKTQHGKYQEIQIYKNRLIKCLKQAEETYYMNIIESEKKNLKNMWDTIGHNPCQMKR